ncbi:hypothetical protein MHYP_G00271590 [Metynnis hypsauchen]
MDCLWEVKDDLKGSRSGRLIWAGSVHLSLSPSLCFSKACAASCFVTVQLLQQQAERKSADSCRRQRHSHGWASYAWA